MASMYPKNSYQKIVAVIQGLKYDRELLVDQKKVFLFNIIKRSQINTEIQKIDQKIAQYQSRLTKHQEPEFHLNTMTNTEQPDSIGKRMSKTDYRIERLQMYFRDPKYDKKRALQIGDIGQACRNIKIALTHLGYKTTNTEKYDKELRDAVLRFQIDQNHTNEDGLVGQGTRRLIARVLYKKSRERIFSLMEYHNENLFPQVFVSYSRKDEEIVREIVSRMTEAGVKLWVDYQNLELGANWRKSIEREIPKSRYFLALLSSSMLSKKGYVHKEIKTALYVLDEYPDSDVYIIPARLDDCEVADHQFSKLNYIDLFPNIETGLERILDFLAEKD